MVRTKLKYAFFIGCVSPIMAKQNEIATRRVAEELDIKLIDVNNFACCGFPVKSMDIETTLLLAARNLSVAEKMGLDICTCCSGCAATLTKANRELIENDKLREDVNLKLQKIGRQYNGSVKVKHFATVLYEDVGFEKIKGKLKKSFDNLTIATHYGCHYHRPSNIYARREDPEFPTSLDELVDLTGAKTVNYEDKMLCCGGNILVVDENITYTMASAKLDHIKTLAVDAINLVCPNCNNIYDRNQRIIERRLSKKYGIPVLFYPQILGLALGIDQEELGLNLNRVKVSPLLAKM
jgi:heterodisulfide reductase subunit B